MFWKSLELTLGIFYLHLNLDQKKVCPALTNLRFLEGGNVGGKLCFIQPIQMELQWRPLSFIQIWTNPGLEAQ